MWLAKLYLHILHQFEKSSINSQYLFNAFSCNNFECDKMSHMGINYSFPFPSRFLKVLEGCFFCCILPRVKWKIGRCSKQIKCKWDRGILQGINWFFQGGKFLCLPYSHYSTCYQQYSGIHRLEGLQFLHTP